MDNWISVKDRLPKERTNVLLFVKDTYCTPPYCYIATGWRLKSDWVVGITVYTNQDITHWMPLPEPPKEES